MYEIFAKLMKAKGCTAYQVAKETGIAQSTLSDWKNGKKRAKSREDSENCRLFWGFGRISYDRTRTGLNYKTNYRVFMRFSAITRRFAIFECANIYILLQIL